MSKIDFLKEQIIEARTFVNRLMSELPEDLWYVIPEGTDSNFIWQVGHLLVSQNFHTLTTVTGVNYDPYPPRTHSFTTDDASLYPPVTCCEAFNGQIGRAHV